jgi:hypothetical protein
MRMLFDVPGSHVQMHSRIRRGCQYYERRVGGEDAEVWLCAGAHAACWG